MRFDQLYDTGATPERLAGDLGLTEGPVWWRGRLYFSDIPNSRRHTWDDEHGLQTLSSATNKGNGQDVDEQGRLYVCEHTTSSVVRFPDPNNVSDREVVASHYDGKELNSPNDVICAPDGSIYFTDPVYGRVNEWVGELRAIQLDFKGVFRVAPGAGPTETTLVGDDFEGPNGLCLSPDGTILYVNDTPRKHIRAFDVRPDGSIANSRVIIDVSDAPGEGGVDGMECDEHGNIWVTGPKGIWAISPTGERIGVIEFPDRCLSLAWGGEDGRDLYVTAWGALYRVRTLVRGHHTFQH